MLATFAALASEALVLPPAQRLSLARRLLDSVNPETEAGVEEAWQEEIARRLAVVDAGEAETVPASEVFARLRRIAP